jgi:hypothetical protein
MLCVLAAVIPAKAGIHAVFASGLIPRRQVQDGFPLDQPSAVEKRLAGMTAGGYVFLIPDSRPSQIDQ